MKTLKLFALLASGLFLFAGAVQAEEPPIRWIVKDGHEANRERASRLYFEATRWVEDRFGSADRKLRPHLTIHVGEECPDPEISGACQSSGLGDLYIPEWNQASAGHVVQAALTMSLLELMTIGDVRGVTKELLAEDVNNFFDISQVAKK